MDESMKQEGFLALSERRGCQIIMLKHTIRFPPEAAEALENMAIEEDVSAAELIRRAINFYQVRMESKKNNKQIVLESMSPDGALVRELVMI